jgi:hypothetical protein
MDILEVHEKIEAYKKLYYNTRTIVGDDIFITFNLLMQNKQPFIFDEYSEFILLNVFLSDDYRLEVYNDYLVRIKKSNGYRDFFHKFLWEWKHQVKVYNYEEDFMRDGCYKYDRCRIYLNMVYHRNYNKHDNRVKNLIVIEEKDRDAMKNRAFETWSDKTGSDDIEEFNDWIEKKQGEIE